jgi:N-acyl-D-amino-acid deacylase
MTRIHLLATLLFGLAPVAGAADDSGPLVTKNTAREAVERGLRIVQKPAASYPSHHSCFSCHHQTLPIFAMVEARERGGATDRDLLQAQADFCRKSFQELVESMVQGGGVGGGPIDERSFFIVLPLNR